MTDPKLDPSSYGVLTYAWLLFLSTLGGFVSFLGKRKKGLVRAFNITELLGELLTSGFAGLLTFYLCEYSQIDPLLTAVFVGISGHMGTRIIFAAEKFLERWAAAKYPILRDMQGVTLPEADTRKPDDMQQ